MGVPCGKSTGQPGGSSTNYRDNGGSPNARNDPNNNPIPPIGGEGINPAAIQLSASGRVNAEVFQVITNVNGIQPSTNPNLMVLRDTIANMASAYEKITQLE